MDAIVAIQEILDVPVVLQAPTIVVQVTVVIEPEVPTADVLIRVPNLLAISNTTIIPDIVDVEIIISANTQVSTITEVIRQAPNLRFNRSAWQARLGRKMDRIKQKLTDNSILLTAHPTDMIRIRVERDERTKDLISRTIESVEVLPIIMPVLKDIPMRRLRQDTNEEIVSFYTFGQQAPVQVYAPYEVQLRRDDLLFRILRDEFSDDPYVMVLQVKDELATIAYSRILHIKYNISFYDEEIPQAVVGFLRDAVTKREALGW